MSDNTKYGNAQDFDVDLHSIYAAYVGLFESSEIDWWDKSWGGYFTSFGDFLGFGWEVMVVVDSHTGRAHVAVRREQIALFAKMIRTRFGESLAKDPPTTLPLSPVPTRTLSLRRLITLTDLASFRKLALTLPAAELSYLRSRVRGGEVGVAEQLFYAGGSSSERDRGGVGVKDNGVGYTWACVKTTWWEKGGAPSGLVPGVGRSQAAKNGKGLVLEVGMAVVRCAHLRAVNVWPPVPQENYRKSHFITEEWVDKRANANPPNHPRAYAFGKSHYVAEKDIERIVDATVGALASQENDSSANTLILLTAGDPPPLPVPSSSTLPANILHLDVLALEYHLLRRAQEQDIPGTPERQHPLPSLASLLQILQIPIPPFAPLSNAGNEAFYTVLAFQKLMMAETRLPDLLFSQPEGYGSWSGYPQPFPQYPMPPPIPPFARTEHRRNSGSSNRNSEYFPQHNPQINQTSSPRFRPASEHTKSRPVSFESSNNPNIDIRPTTPEHYHRQPDSAPNTVRQSRRPLPRSQTVYWDDAEYAHSPDPSSPRHKRESGTLTVPLKPSATGGSHSSEEVRGRGGPPSAMRNAQNGGTVRSVSWEAGAGPQEQGHPRRGLSSSSLVGAKEREREGGGSSTKLSSGSDSKASSEYKGLAAVGRKGSRDEGKGVKVDVGVEKGEKGREGKEGKEGKSKLKSEKSVKDIAGALARFWVG